MKNKQEIVNNRPDGDTGTLNQGRERSEVLADALCEEIVEGRLRPGEKLNETDIGSRFNVSRGPVREALRRLSERHLVVFSPNAGARVIRHSLRDMLDLLEVRVSLEVAAVKLAAERMTKEEVFVLRSLFEAHSNAVLTSQQNLYLQSPEDLDFHYVIAKGAGNPVLFKILCEDLYPRLRICRRQHQHISGRGAQALEEHRRILWAIEENDGELAEILMRRHLTAARESLKASLDDSGTDEQS